MIEKLIRSLTQSQIPCIQRYLNLWLVFCKTILGCEILNVHTFWKTLFSDGYFGNAFVYQCKQKRSIWIISQRMVSISSVEATNQQHQHQLQASNTISFASLSAHCHHSDCVDRSVVHLGKTATKQRNLLMDDIYLEFFWIWRLFVLATTNQKQATYFAHSKF